MQVWQMAQLYTLESCGHRLEKEVLIKLCCPGEYGILQGIRCREKKPKPHCYKCWEADYVYTKGDYIPSCQRGIGKLIREVKNE